MFRKRAASSLLPSWQGSMKTRGLGYIYPEPSPVLTPMSTSRLRKTKSQSRTQSTPVQWLFRSNIPRRRTSFMPTDVQKRNFFGLGDIFGVLANPAETLRSLTESKRLLEEARREIEENKERAQLRVKHTFSRYPGFFPRPAEVNILEQVLHGEPSFTVLFGSSSAGKTALLREVLCNDAYHVLHFDLRIAGFADLPSLYTSLSQQMEQYFDEIGKQPGFEEFEKEAWAFKHDRLNVERRIIDMPQGSDLLSVRTSDVARLMELFQSSLLKYREFEPLKSQPKADNSQHNSSSPRRFPFFRKGKGKDVSEEKMQHKESLPSPKKIPVILFDEAHRLPALIHSIETMKCLLDSMLVLTKQDRLCHVIHATSDPFYQTWLRQLNVMQHCKIITIGDCSKAETRAYFSTNILDRVPRKLHSRLDFERLYEAFGGKLAHWHDYITDFVNSGGTLEIKQSSHFLQAHALLNLHLVHTSQSPSSNAMVPSSNRNSQVDSNKGRVRVSSNTPTALHPRLGPAGFRIYSPITNPNPQFASAGGGPGSGADYFSGAEFSAMDLLKVMGRLTSPPPAYTSVNTNATLDPRRRNTNQSSIPGHDRQYLAYFPLCRELGVRAVDGLVKGRVLDLRWTECVTNEWAEERLTNGHNFHGHPESINLRAAASSPTAVESIRTAPSQQGVHAPDVDARTPSEATSEHDMIPVSEGEALYTDREPYFQYPEHDDIVVGCKLVPSPIMRFAMREVVAEYEDQRSVSDYMSLSDVDVDEY
ncbi:hypothetical protein MIND_01201200 [Mycena indigotica]|uniref:AAA+ ATPase domain-containing protein n=1 Tax=Mycena indigotica TaxID=2126181 RepID=A0A8H6VYQ3_9AGAR|nr:uncharacterized protein MIND_01201200 [Mycena indigotica]KAF7293019.1 hypothetical protein MIND_01201200 [Mycena indigotica]